jgi:hypothetical protein
MLDAECEVQDLFIHRQHSEDVRFIVPTKPQYPDSYRVPDNDRRITVQAHFSGPQEDAHKKTSLKNQIIFLVGFTFVSAFGYTQILIGFENL